MAYRHSRRRVRHQSLGSLGEPITGSAFLLYAGGAALLALLFGGKKSTTQRVTTTPGAGAGAGSNGAGAGTTAPTGSTASGTLPSGPQILGPGVIRFPGNFVATKFEDKWTVSGEAKEKFPEYTVEYWLDLKRRNAASDVSDRVRSMTYESCRIYGGTKESCSNLISTKSLEYCVFSEYADSSEEVTIRECSGKLPNDAYIAQDMNRYA